MHQFIIIAPICSSCPDFFEPNLLSFFITQSSVASCMSTDISYQMEFLRKYYFKEKLWFENTVNLKSIYSLIFFFFLNFFFWFACCFFLFRLLNFLFQYFTLIKNLPVAKNSVKYNGLNIRKNIFKFYKVLHNTQMRRWNPKISIFGVSYIIIEWPQMCFTTVENITCPTWAWVIYAHL